VHARARRIVGADADDIVQELFARLLRSSPRQSAIASFIYSTSSNLCIDRLRHRARRERPDWLREVARTFDAATDLDRQLTDRQLCRHLIARAPTAMQETTVLYYFDEMTQAEIAERLGVSRKTVVERIARFHDYAREQMRTWKS
jgi:RNA polymerase sigma-70 factor (ECF subfamily)